MNDRNNQYAQSMFTNMQNSEGGFFNNNPPPKLGEKSITENGTYTAKEDKLDGYSSVTADVAGGGETFVVNVTVDEGTEKMYADKTLTQTLEAYNNGCNIVFKGMHSEQPDLATVSFSVMCTDESRPQTVTNIYGNFGLARHPMMDNKFFGYGVYYLNENELAFLYLIEFTG